MKTELRADGLHISGYVNVPGRQSRPVITPQGRVIEVIEQEAFSRALERAEKVEMLLDHDHGRVLADTGAGTLSVKEDAVGLRAESVVTDPEVIDGARNGKLRGWSFDIRNPKSYLEERAEGLPIRHITDLDMTEISLVMNRVPCYSSTSIEVRADHADGEAVEYRAELPEQVEFSDLTGHQKGSGSAEDERPSEKKKGFYPERKLQMMKMKLLKGSR